MFFLDFDGTLYDTHLFVDAMNNVFAEYDVPKDVAIETQRTAIFLDKLHYDYTFERHIKALAEVGFDLPEKEVLEKLNALTHQKDYSKEYMEEFLKDLKKYGRKLILLTAGNNAFQRMKVESTCVPAYVDDIVVVHGEKEKVVRDMKIDGEQTFFINDKVPENETVKKLFPDVEVITFHNPYKLVGIKDPELDIPTFSVLKDVSQYIDSIYAKH